MSLKKRKSIFSFIAILFCFLIVPVFAVKRINQSTSVADAAGYSVVSFTFGASTSGDHWAWDNDNGVLTLSGVTWTEPGENLELPNRNVTIELEGTNALNSITTSNSGYTLTITGTGNLTLSYISVASNNVVISGGNITIENDEEAHGISCNALTVSGGDTQITTAGTFVAVTCTTLSVTNGVSTYAGATTPGTLVPSPDEGDVQANYVHFEAPAHVHNHNDISTSGATLTASCSANDGTSVSTSLYVPDINYGETPAPMLTGLSEFNNTATGLNLSLSDFTLTYSPDENPTDAGHYTLTAVSNNNIGGAQRTLVCEFDILKLNPSSTGSNTTIDYTDAPYTLTGMFTVDSNAGTAAYTIVGGTGTGSISGNVLTVTACGTFEIKLTTAANTNYNSQEVTNTLTVNKVARTGFTVTMNGGYDAGGVASSPAISNYVENGTCSYSYYSVGSSGATSGGTLLGTTAPTTAGFYYVKAEIEETANYNLATAYDAFTVWATPTITNALGAGEIISTTYGALGVNSQYDVSDMFNVDVNAGTASYTLVSAPTGSSLTGTTLTVGAVGDHVVRVTTAINGYYKSATKDLTLRIVKDTLSVTISISNWTYGQSASVPSITGNTYDGEETITYYTDSARENAVLGTPQDARLYYVRLSVAATNFSDAATAETTVTILKKEVAITWSAGGFTYDGTTHSVTATYKDISNNDISLSVAITKNAESAIVKDAGTYVATASFANGETNYVLPTEKSQSYVVSPAALTVTVSSVNTDYGTSTADINALLDGTITSGALVAGDSTPYSFTTVATSSSAVGKYDIIGQTNDTNYDITFVNEDDSLTINNKILTFTMANWTVGGTPSTPSITVANSESATYSYIAKADYDNGSMEFVATQPTAIGNYVIKAFVDGAEAYLQATAYAEFSILKNVATSTGEDKTVVYGVTGYDIITTQYYPTTYLVGDDEYGESYLVRITDMFVVDQNAGAATFTIVGGTGEYDTLLFDGEWLYVDQCGTFIVQLSTAGNSDYEPQQIQKTLTVNKGTRANFDNAHTSMTDGYYPGANAQLVIPGYTDNAELRSLIVCTYYTDDEYTVLAGNGSYPASVGTFYVKAVISETGRYNSATSYTSFKMWGVPTITDLSTSVSYESLLPGQFDVSTLFNIDANAGTASYALVSPQIGATLNGTTLTVSAIGDYTIQVSTLATEAYIAGNQTATLTVTKAQLSGVTVSIANWGYGDNPNEPIFTGETFGGDDDAVIAYYSEDFYLSDDFLLEGVPTELGEYFAKITVPETDYSLETVLYCSFSIVPKVVEIEWGSVADRTFTYNGQVQPISVTYEDVDGNHVELEFTISAEFRNAGVYTVTVTAFKNGETDYALPSSPEQLSAEYVIEKVNLSVGINQTSVLHGTSDSVINSKLSSNNAFEIISGSVVLGDEIPFALSTTATSASAVGLYDINGTTTNENYNITFNDGTNAFVVKNKITSLVLSSWVYGETPSELSYSAAYGEITSVLYCGANEYYSELNPDYTTTQPTEPGDYIVLVKVESETEYYRADQSLTFAIEKISVDEPAEDTTEFTYTGASQLYVVAENNLYTTSGTTRINAGTNIVTISLVDTNHYKWTNTNNSEPLEYEFVIEPIRVIKPLANTRKYIYSGEPQTYTLQTNENYTISNNTTQTEAGIYEIIVTLNNPDEVNNYVWTDGTASELKFYFTIYRSEITEPATTDAEGKVLNDNPVKIISSENGLDPNIVLAVKVIDDSDKQQTENVREILNDTIDGQDKIFKVYDVSLLLGDNSVQPDGSITLELEVPYELRNSNFRLYHIHTDSVTGEVSVTTINYGQVDKDGKIYIQLDKLSQLVFVNEQTSIAWLVIVLACICGLLAVLLLIQVIVAIKKHKNKSAKLAAAAPLFFIPAQVTASIVLGAIIAVLLIANIWLFVAGKKKVAQTEKNKK